jgi:putative phosphoesterase
MFMKFFIISDIHGSLPAIKQALKAYEIEKADMLIICGDYLNHGPRNDIPLGYNPKEVAEILNEKKDSIICVRGNCDSEVDQMLLEFPVLDASSSLFIGNKRVLIHHGHLYTEKQLEKWTKPGDIILSGHTHISLLEKKEERVFCNPGSISIPKGNTIPSYGILTENKLELKALSDFVVYNTLEL